MTRRTCHIQPFDPRDAKVVSSLVRRVFDEHVAPSFGPDGVAEMHTYVAPEAIASRALTHLTLVAMQPESHESDSDVDAPGQSPDDAQIVGVIEVRGLDHVSMLFVRTSHMGQGIASALLARAEARCSAKGRAALTVNSSLDARGFYERHGFVPSNVPQCVHGFAFVPMEKVLA